MERRSFLKHTTAVTVTGVTAPVWAQTAGAAAGAAAARETDKLPRAASIGTLRGEMLYRPLGKTGVEISAIGLGGHHLGVPSLTDDESVRLIHQALDRGINFLDNSWDYHGGRSELLAGKALAQGGYRKKAFVMTKLDARTKQLALEQIDTSLQRLKVDHIDLIQHHEIIRYDDPDRIFTAGGAMEGVLAAKQAGKVRFVGFTGHKDPRIHLYMLDVAAQHGFHFDTAQMPLNVMDAHFRSFARLVVPRLLQEGIAVLGMKSLGGGEGIILKTGAVTAAECIHYALSLPTATVICGIDKQEVLDQAFRLVKGFQLMSEQQVESLLKKTRQLALGGEYELFKTTAHFDATAKHADWLGEDPPYAKKLVPATG